MIIKLEPLEKYIYNRPLEDEKAELLMVTSSIFFFLLQPACGITVSVCIVVLIPGDTNEF